MEDSRLITTTVEFNVRIDATRKRLVYQVQHNGDAKVAESGLTSCLDIWQRR